MTRPRRPGRACSIAAIDRCSVRGCSVDIRINSEGPHSAELVNELLQLLRPALEDLAAGVPLRLVSRNGDTETQHESGAPAPESNPNDPAADLSE